MDVFKIEYIEPCKKGQRMGHQTNKFIKVTHEESGISATGHSTKNEIDAVESAKEQIRPLIEIWKNSVV